ncbi:hypothetical protein D3C87_241170 [compost metagenome]
MKKLLLSVLMLSLVGCAFDKDKGTTDRAEIQDRQNLEKNHKLIVGTYQGIMTTPSRKHDIELTLFSLEIRDGENSKGLPKYRKELRALYKKINPVGPDVTFDARFFAEMGQLILTPLVSPKGADDISTIDAKLVGQRLTGKVSSISGEVGYLDVALVSKQQDVPEQGAEDDYHKRLRKQYEEVKGTYEGIVMPPENDPFAISISLNVTVNSDGVPLITGELSYPFDRSLDMTLTVNYRPDLTPPKLTLIGKPKTGNSPTGYTQTFDGVIKDGKFVGAMSSTDNVDEGQFSLKKK